MIGDASELEGGELDMAGVGERACCRVKLGLCRRIFSEYVDRRGFSSEFGYIFRCSMSQRRSEPSEGGESANVAIMKKALAVANCWCVVFVRGLSHCVTALGPVGCWCSSSQLSRPYY